MTRCPSSVPVEERADDRGGIRMVLRPVCVPGERHVSSTDDPSDSTASARDALVTCRLSVLFRHAGASPGRVAEGTHRKRGWSCGRKAAWATSWPFSASH